MAFIKGVILKDVDRTIITDETITYKDNYKLKKTVKYKTN
jgi:hypothetical protein